MAKPVHKDMLDRELSVGDFVIRPQRGQSIGLGTIAKICKVKVGVADFPPSRYGVSLDYYYPIAVVKINWSDCPQRFFKDLPLPVALELIKKHKDSLENDK